VQASDGTTTALASGVINKIPYTSAGTTFVLNVLNSGTITEYAVTTEIHFKKLGLSTSCLTKTSQIRKTVPGYTYLSSIVITPATCASPSDFINVPLDMTAGVVPLPGETNKMNNFQTFLVEFTQ
jgi:hypothetical protein